ncbi:MAG: T9SS type A sorting domain-containing protein [Saprospiraceae bacterium]
MRLTLLLSLLISLTGTLSAQLIISGIVDGPLMGGTPKAIEVYAQVDIANLGIYGLATPNNGDPSAGTPEFTFPAISVSAGTFLYVASQAPPFVTFFGFAPNYTNFVANINGNDAVELYKSGTVVDVFGVVGENGTGKPWEYTDGWAKRNDLNNPPAPSTTYDPANWLVQIGALIGEATNATAANPFPLGFALPVTLLSFNAQTAAKTVRLEWATTAETDNDYFAIERSADGGRTFTEIGRVRGAGSSELTAEYAYTDAAPLAGENYYRLRQVDFDGSTAYFGPLSVRMLDGGAANVAVFSNPVRGQLFLTTDLATVGDISILNASGRLVRRVAGLGKTESGIDVTDLASGVYFLRLSGEGETQTIRFVK